MRHNSVSGQSDPLECSHWAVGLSLPFPRSGWQGGILVQVQGPEARQCRLVLRVAEAGALEAALRGAAAEVDATFLREAELSDARFAEAAFPQHWSVRSAPAGAVAVHLRDHRGHEDEVAMSADDAVDFADGVAARIADFGSEAVREQIASLEAAAVSLAGPAR